MAAKLLHEMSFCGNGVRWTSTKFLPDCGPVKSRSGSRRGVPPAMPRRRSDAPWLLLSQFSELVLMDIPNQISFELKTPKRTINNAFSIERRAFTEAELQRLPTIPNVSSTASSLPATSSRCGCSAPRRHSLVCDLDGGPF